MPSGQSCPARAPKKESTRADRFQETPDHRKSNRHRGVAGRRERAGPDQVPLSEVKRSEVKGSEPNARVRAHASDELTNWLGDLSACLERWEASTELADGWRDGLYNQFGPPEMDAAAWKLPSGGSIPAERRPRIVALAIERMATEGAPLRNQHFRAVLKAVASEQDSESREQGPDAGWNPVGDEDFERMYGR